MLLLRQKGLRLLRIHSSRVLVLELEQNRSGRPRERGRRQEDLRADEKSDQH
jgi:hypothetical protein